MWELLNNDLSYDSIIKVLFVTLIIKSLIIPTNDFGFKEFKKNGLLTKRSEFGFKDFGFKTQLKWFVYEL